MSSTHIEFLQGLILGHLRGLGGSSSHAELALWAAALGVSDDELDRALVCAERWGLVRIRMGRPACTATRMISTPPLPSDLTRPVARPLT